MSTIRGYNVQNISADTGEVVVWAQTQSSPGLEEQIAIMRLRLKTNTPQIPYVGAQMLATVRWHDGDVVQSWNLAISTDVNQYAEQGMEFWADGCRAITIQVSPLSPGGSIDARLVYKEF